MLRYHSDLVVYGCPGDKLWADADAHADLDQYADSDGYSYTDRYGDSDPDGYGYAN